MQLRAGFVEALSAILSWALLASTARAQRPEEVGPAVVPEEVAVGASKTANEGSNLNGSVRADVAQYADSDHVFVFTPSIAGSVTNPLSGWQIDGHYLVDVVSAASVDIVSTASRRWEEVRHEGSLAAAYKPATFGLAAYGLVSSEPDYLSLSGGGSITQDLLQKNLTLLLGYDYGHDVAGRSGTPFSVFSHPLDRHAFKGGATLILDPATLAAFVTDVIVENGDPSKPYRYVPLFAPGQYVPLGASVDLVTSLRASARPLEQLPLSRTRFAPSARLAHRFRGSTLRVDERLYIDSWGLKASSTDGRYLFDLGRVEVGPHLRAHLQSPVNFWQRAYVFGPGFHYPALRTGDRELGPLVNLTFGGSLKIGVGPASNSRAWVLGVDLNGIWTQYLDDLYTRSRLSSLAAISLEAEL